MHWAAWKLGETVTMEFRMLFFLTQGSKLRNVITQQPASHFCHHFISGAVSHHGYNPLWNLWGIGNSFLYPYQGDVLPTAWLNLSGTWRNIRFECDETGDIKNARGHFRHPFYWAFKRHFGCVRTWRLCHIIKYFRTVHSNKWGHCASVHNWRREHR